MDETCAGILAANACCTVALHDALGGDDRGWGADKTVLDGVHDAWTMTLT